jgi:malic enzyme
VANATFADSRIVIYGAGAAGLGIQRQLRALFVRVLPAFSIAEIKETVQFPYRNKKKGGH